MVKPLTKEESLEFEKLNSKSFDERESELLEQAKTEALFEKERTETFIADNEAYDSLYR